jgi:thymidylate kinase
MTVVSGPAAIAGMVDDVVENAVLVVGSPPPEGHDLDLLARPAEYTALAGWLLRSGFVRRHQSWLRVDGDDLLRVDLSCTRQWRAKDPELGPLFEDTEPLDGLDRLVRPSPAGVLLLAAHSLVVHRVALTHKSRARVAQALARDPDAWSAADRAAGRIGLERGLRLLRRTYDSGEPLSLPVRAAGWSALWLGGGVGRDRSRSSGARTPRWRPVIASFSGLDGSGKSTQAVVLRDALRRLGISAEVQWAGFKTGSRLRAKLPVLDRVQPTRSRADGAAPQRDPLVPAACRETALGQHLWLGHVVLVNLLALWGHVVSRRDVRVLIFDRFAPDSALKLELRYRLARRFDTRWESALFAALSPKPDVGFLVQVPSEVAYDRRHDQEVPELDLMCRLYDEQAARFGLTRLDGTLPVEALRTQVLAAVWQALG